MKAGERERKLSLEGKGERPQTPPLQNPRLFGSAAAIVATMILFVCVAIVVRRSALTIESSPAVTVPPPSTTVDEAPKTNANEHTPAIPDPQAPRPATTEELIQEIHGILAHVTGAFPQNVDCLELHARVYIWLGNTSEAERLRKKCLELNPNYASACLGLAAIAEKRGDSKSAAQWAVKALEIDPMFNDARITAAASYLRLGKPERAMDVLKGKEQKLEPQQFLLLGQAHLQQEEFDQALENYQTALDREPDLAPALYGMSLAYTRLGQHHKAEEALEKYRTKLLAVSTNGMRRETSRADLERMLATAADFYTHAGRIYASQHHPAVAAQLWRRAAQLNSDDTQSRHELLRFFRASGQSEEALRLLEELTQIEPHNADPWLLIGEIHADANRLDATEQALRRSCEIDPQNAKCLEALAVFFVQTNRHMPEALGAAKRVVDLKPTAATYALLAVAAFRNGDRDQALLAIKEAVARDPRNPKYQQMLNTMQSQSQPPR